MANGANLTVEQFTESVAKQIAAELKLDGTDLVNRLVSSLSKGLIDKIAQKQISTPIAQQSSQQNDNQDKTLKESLQDIKSSIKQTNDSSNKDAVVKGISELSQKMQGSLQVLSKDFTKAIGYSNSILKGFTDKFFDTTLVPQKEDKFPNLLKRQFVSFEKHLTELFKTKQSSSKVFANNEQKAKEIKTIFENSSTQREQTKQFQDLGKNQNEHLKKAVETLRDILGSSEELVSLQDNEKSEPERFWDNFKKLPETIESKIGEKLKGAAFNILPKSVTSFVSRFVEGKSQEKDSKGDIKELKEAIKQSQKTKEQPKSALETTEQVQKVKIDSISGMASGQLLDILPTAIKEGISSVDEKIGKILEFLEKTLLTEIKNKAGGDSSGGIMSVIETLLYAKLLSRFKPLLGGLGRGIQNLGKGGFNLARGALGGLGTLATTPIASMGAAGAAGTVAAGVVGGELIGGMAGQAIGSNEAVSEALYGSPTAGKEAYEKYGTGMIGFSRASYDYLFGEGAKVRKETAETEAKTTEMQKTLEESQIAISEYFKSKGFKNLQEFGAAVKAGETEPVKWNKETKKLDVLPLKTNQTAATVTSKPFEPEKSQTFTPLQPTEKLPAVDTEKAPAVKPTDVSKETPKIAPQPTATTDKQMELNNNFLSHIDSNTSSTNQNIANLVTSFNNLASALKSNGINVPTTPPVVVNTPPPAPQQEPSTVIAKQSTSSIPDYRGFAMQAQPRAI